LFYPSKACFNEEIKQKSPSLVKQGGLYAWIEPKTRVHGILPEGSQKESEKQSESDDFSLSFYFALVLLLFLMFLIARAMIFHSLFTSHSFSFSFYFNKKRER
jgi:hypothetical protein